jgi:DHA1 family bicyclomycin/chloramphenicol resistance-like MFS transporter
MTVAEPRLGRPVARLAQGEFIALMAMLTATVAFSIDSMLPALADIGRELTPDAPNSAQLILTSFVLGMGIGTFFTGPLSDAFGRRTVMVGGALIYVAASVAAYFAASLNEVLIARLVMGLGAAGPRVAAVAMVRDSYGGRDMARIMSFVMIIFTLVPALAPSLGAVIIAGFGWRALFVAFVVFALTSTLWLMLRQPETLAPADRRPLSLAALTGAVAEMFANPTARLSIMVQVLCFGMLFSVLSSIQQVFAETFDQAAAFPLWFGGIAVVAATGSMLNARLVVRVGMPAMIKGMLTVQIGLTLLMIAISLAQPPYWLAFGTYLVWTASLFFQAGVTIGNLNALAMEPMGHIAGLAASVIASVATVGAVVIAVPIGLAFDGTPVPLAAGILVCAVLALWLTARIRRPTDL